MCGILRNTARDGPALDIRDLLLIAFVRPCAYRAKGRIDLLGFRDAGLVGFRTNYQNPTHIGEVSHRRVYDVTKLDCAFGEGVTEIGGIAWRLL